MYCHYFNSLAGMNPSKSQMPAPSQQITWDRKLLLFWLKANGFLKIGPS